MLPAWHTANIAMKPDVCVIVMDEDPMRPRAPFWGYRTDIVVPGDIPGNLQLVRDALNYGLMNNAVWKEKFNSNRIKWENVIRDYRIKRSQEIQLEVGKFNGKIHSSELFNILLEILPEGSALVDEIIAPMPYLMHAMTHNPKKFMSVHGWLGGLGTGVPVALGLKLAIPTSIVVAIIGDGALHYTPIPASFGFAQQYQIPILIIICNNTGFISQGWNIEKYYPDGGAVRTNNYYGRPIEPTPNYSLLAHAYGGFGECVSELGELEEAIRRAVTHINVTKSFALLDIKVKP